MFHGIFKNGEPVFNSPLLKEYALKHEGQPFILEPDTRSTAEKIRFFEVIVKYFFYQHEPGVFENFKEARDCLKCEINPIKVRDFHGRVHTEGESMSEIFKNNARTMRFLEKCQDAFRVWGYEFPDSTDYQEWFNKAPGIDSEYPPLARLITKYQETVKERFPWKQFKPE